MGKGRYPGRPTAQTLDAIADRNKREVDEHPDKSILRQAQRDQMDHHIDANEGQNQRRDVEHGLVRRCRAGPLTIKKSHGRTYGRFERYRKV